MMSMEEVKDRLIARYSAEDIVEMLSPDCESLVEGLHEWIYLHIDEVLPLIDYDDGEDDVI